MTIISSSAKQTQILARKIAEKILAGKMPHIFGLTGNLGAGKTTFIQGFAKALKIKEKILSPTFIIMRELKIRTNSPKLANFYHIDCYRIENANEILHLNFEEILANPKNIIVVEWADKIKKIMPKNSLWINFEHLKGNKRKIIISNLRKFNHK